MQTAGAKRAAHARQRASGGTDAVDELLSQLQEIEQAYGQKEQKEQPEVPAAPARAKVSAADAIKNLSVPSQTEHTVGQLVNCSAETLKIAQPERRRFRDSFREFVGAQPKQVHGLVNCSSVSRKTAKKGEKH